MTRADRGPIGLVRLGTGFKQAVGSVPKPHVEAVTEFPAN